MGLIDEIPNNIEIEKSYPCKLCGESVVNAQFCNEKCRDEWKLRNIKKEYKPLPSNNITTKKAIKNFNESPSTKTHKVLAIRKSTKYIAIGLIMILFGILIWSNVIESGKDYAPKVDVTNPITVNPAQTEILNEYQNNNDHTINVYLDYDEISEMIADEVLEIINNETS